MIKFWFGGHSLSYTGSGAQNPKDANRWRTPSNARDTTTSFWLPKMVPAVLLRRRHRECLQWRNNSYLLQYNCCVFHYSPETKTWYKSSIKKTCLLVYRMGTNLSPLCLLKKYGFSKAIEGKPHSSIFLVIGGRRASVLSFQNYI